MFRCATQTLAASEPSPGLVLQPALARRAPSSAAFAHNLHRRQPGTGHRASRPLSRHEPGQPTRRLDRPQAISGIHWTGPASPERAHESPISTHHRCAKKQNAPIKRVQELSANVQMGARVGLKQVCVQFTQGCARPLKNNPCRTHCALCPDDGCNDFCQSTLSTRMRFS